jgi:hypothetical protein
MIDSNSSIDNNSNKPSVSDKSKNNAIILEISEELKQENIVSEIKYLPLQKDLKITFSEEYDNETLYIPLEIKNWHESIEKLKDEIRIRTTTTPLKGGHYLLIENSIRDNHGLLQEITGNNSSSIHKDEQEQEECKDDDPARSYRDIFGGTFLESISQETHIINNHKNTDINTSASISDSSIINIHELRSKIRDSDYLGYIIKTIKKTVKCDDILIKQILYASLSTYTQSDPINLGILAPTSEGKTYPVEECIKLFPKQDVYKIGSMSAKVLVRQKGILVDKMNIPLNPRLKELQKKREGLESNKKEESERITEQIEELKEDSRTLIDLSGKILVFLEPPQKEVWDILKPILSHDSKEIEFPFVNTDNRNGIYAKKVVVRGWPACIFCSAKDESKLEVWSEIKSRFLITSPNMVPEKYKQSVKLIAQTKGLPALIQQQIIRSEGEVELAKGCILYIKQKITELQTKDVWIPFLKLLEQEMPANKGTDVRFVKRIFSLLNLIPLLRSEQRKVLMLENQMSVIAEVEDLKEALEITQNFDGIPKYKKDFYNEIFYPCYKLKTEPDRCNQTVFRI